MNSAAVVVDALASTSKGKLNYDYPWGSSTSPVKLELLHTLTSPPPFSPEVLQILTERTQRLSLSHNDDPDPDPDPHLRGNKNAIYESTYRLSPSSNLYLPHVSMATRGGTPDVVMATRDLNQETVDPLELTETDDDILMHELERQVSLGRKHFSVDRMLSRDGDFPGLSDYSVIDQSKEELKEYEELLGKRLVEYRKSNVDDTKQKFMGELGRLQEESRLQYDQERSVREKRRRAEKARQEAEERQQRQAIDAMIEGLRESYMLHGEVLQAKLRTGEEQKQEILKKIEEEKRRKAIQRLKLVQQCQQLNEEAEKLMRKFSAIIKSCHHPHLLPDKIMSCYEASLLRLRSIKEFLLAQEQSGNPDESRVELSHTHLTALLPVLATIKSMVEEANLKGEAEVLAREKLLLEQAAQKLQEEQLAKAQQQQQAADREQVELQPGKLEVTEQQQASTATSSSDKVSSELGMPKSMIEVYGRLQENLSTAVESYGSLTTSKDLQLKKYRFDLQKAVSIPINAISAQSGEHLLDKIVRLKRLFSGQSVEVMGKSLTISYHPQAKPYCCNLLAKKVVKQGEEQVASRSDAAFPIAAVAVGIWADFTELGDLILAHFHASCPVLVPFHIPKKPGMSTADHMRLQGYKVSEDGTVESEDIYLKRMSGIVRLYAAIIQTPCLDRQKPHPHGLEHGWAWLARVLNMEPHPTITATALYDFMEVAGHALMKKYGRQFKKLLFVLCKEYVHKIEKVTPQTDLGPLSRLKQFLEDCIAAGRIPEPKGYLTQDFWRTRSHGIAIA